MITSARRRHWVPRHGRGVATIEFVAAAPLLLFLLVAISELGRAFVQYTALANTVRNSARYVAGQALNGSTGVVSVSSQLVDRGRNLVAYGSTGTGTPILPGLAPGQVSVTNAGAGNISVSVVYPYQALFGATLPTFGQVDPPSLVFDMGITVTMRALP
jgi:Flp pilus assembly protein TadG